MAAIAAAYLYLKPEHGRDTYGVVHTDGGVYLPDWWQERDRLGIRVLALTEEDLKLPLLDIVKRHAHELRGEEVKLGIGADQADEGAAAALGGTQIDEQPGTDRRNQGGDSGET